MKSKFIITVLIVGILVLAGCVSSGDRLSSTEQVLSTPAPTSVEQPSADDGLLMVAENESNNCTIVTQYGGRVKSCYIVILPDRKSPAKEMNPHVKETQKPPQTPLTPHETQVPNEMEEKLIGKWKISSGSLSSFPNLHFIGDGDFSADGQYKISTNPQEFNPREGIILYTGIYEFKNGAIVGNGKSTIYQGGQVFGSPATDTFTARFDDSGEQIMGSINSLSGFHDGGGAGNATFVFVLEKA